MHLLQERYDRRECFYIHAKSLDLCESQKKAHSENTETSGQLSVTNDISYELCLLTLLTDLAG